MMTPALNTLGYKTELKLSQQPYRLIDCPLSITIFAYFSQYIAYFFSASYVNQLMALLRYITVKMLLLNSS